MDKRKQEDVAAKRKLGTSKELMHRSTVLDL
jgi:hypothetical protein